MPLVPYRVELGKPRINALIYSRPGVGKTTLAASAAEHPDLGPVLFASFEGGLLSVAGRGVDAVDIHSITEVDELFWLIRNGTPPYNQYKTIVIDSGSEMQTLALEEATRADIELQRKKGKAGAMDRTLDDIELQNYGKAGAQLARMFRWFRDLPLNVVVTALPKFVYSQGANERTAAPLEVLPSFTNRLSTQVMGYMDFVWYLYEEGGRRFLLTRDSGGYRAKTRGFNFAQALGSHYPDPWLPTMYELLIESESAPLGQYVPKTNGIVYPSPSVVTPAQAEEEFAAAMASTSPSGSSPELALPTDAISMSPTADIVATPENGRPHDVKIEETV